MVSCKCLTIRVLMSTLAALALATLVGCGGRVIRPASSVLREVQNDTYSDRDWAIVLRDHVRYGLVDYDTLRANSDPLMRYCALISIMGPARTPGQFSGRAQATAYYINAYNALVLRAVLSQPPDIPTMYDLSLPQLEYDYKLPLDGELVTLAQIEGKILQSSNNDVRALLATSRAAMGTPRLPNEPLRAETLDRQLAEAAAEALDLPEILHIDHTTLGIQVWQLILQRQNDFVDYWKSQRRVRTAFLFQVLQGVCSPAKRRALQSAVGYTFRVNAFDRALNRWEKLSGRTGRSGVP